MFRSFLIGVILATWMASSAVAERTKLERPIRTLVSLTDGTRLSGQVVGYDLEGFDLVNADKETVSVAWIAMSADDAFRLYAQFIQKAPAEAWVELGGMLLTMNEGKEWAERAFDRALKIDKSVADKIEAARQAAADPIETTPAEGDVPDAGDAGGGDAGMGGTPKTVGEVQKQFWGELTDEQHAAAIEELKAFAEETKVKVAPNLRLHETKFFLFYSDIPPAEAKKWAGLLDRMYGRLSELFGVEKGVNVWRGRALVFVFNKDSDYRTFQQVMHNTDPSWSAGMCHTYGNGAVHIAFYRQPNPTLFAKVLVHESVHGYLHRYRSPVHIPPWANEGLAEVISSELVLPKGHVQAAQSHARAEVARRKGLPANFFDGRFEPWMYPVAEALCNFMIRENRRGYVNFINGIKDGLSWEESLVECYGADHKRIEQAFKNSLNVR